MIYFNSSQVVSPRKIIVFSYVFAAVNQISFTSLSCILPSFPSFLQLFCDFLFLLCDVNFYVFYNRLWNILYHMHY